MSPELGGRHNRDILLKKLFVFAPIRESRSALGAWTWDGISIDVCRYWATTTTTTSTPTLVHSHLPYADDDDDDGGNIFRTIMQNSVSLWLPLLHDGHAIGDLNESCLCLI